jgi:hypothetical protein
MFYQHFPDILLYFSSGLYNIDVKKDEKEENKEIEEKDKNEGHIERSLNRTKIKKVQTLFDSLQRTFKKYYC